MKLSYLITILFYFPLISFAQQPFLLSLEQPDVDAIGDAVQIEDRYYLIQNRSKNLESNYNKDTNSDIVVLSEDGAIIEVINLNGFRTDYQRILKVEGEDIYLVGYIKSDSCESKIVFSKFNIFSHALEHLSSYDFCDYIVVDIIILTGLLNHIFLDVNYYDTLENRRNKIIFSVDSTFHLSPLFEDVAYVDMLSVDFSRTGYVLASPGLYNFYDAEFNFRKQKYVTEYGGIAYHSTHIPFGRNYILEQYVQNVFSKPDPGILVRLVDSNLVVRKKAVILPSAFIGLMAMPFHGGISIQNENEIWAAGMFGYQPNTTTSIYSITKLDSNLNIVCQHFLGYDTKYTLFGIQSFSSGGGIIFGSRIREGHSKNEGKDIYAIRVGENCELPAIVSTNGPTDPLFSISAYPNPGLNDLTFSVNGFEPASLRVELINESGQVLYSKTDLTNSIQVPNLPAGQYFYRILKSERLLGIGAWVKANY